MATSVLIALSEPFVRMGVEATLAEQAEFDVVGHADELDGVVAAVAEHTPQVLILDSRFQQRDDKLMPAVMELNPECKVLVMVDHTDEECTVRRLLTGPREHKLDSEMLQNLRECCLLALRESAKGCLPKASSPERLVSTLEAITAGQVWAGPGLSEYFVELVRSEPGRESKRITRRELDVIALLVEGLSNKEVAGRLKLSEQTVKNHVGRIMDKVGTRNRVELVLYAVRERLA
jgi:DNA-binding NarL/FixJ family response regulator